MSDIPRAREILKLARKAEDQKFKDQAIDRAIGYLDREKPEFKVEHDCTPVTKEEAAWILRLRGEGKSLREIAAITGQNSGRISEVINGKREGI